MDSNNRMNVDRLSSLPDDLIHKILSFIDIKDAIGSSALSSRWRFIWISMPYLNFSSENYHPLAKFSRFVEHVLSRRNNQIQVFSIELSCRRFDSAFVKRILESESSCHVQQLNITCRDVDEHAEKMSLFSSKFLKHLTLTCYGYRHLFIIASPCELPNLTTLHLDNVELCCVNTDKCIDLFSNSTSLKNLTLNYILVTILENPDDVEVVNVVSPQLVNLDIRYCEGARLICGRDLVSLSCKDDHSLQLSIEGCTSLEKADLCICEPENANAHRIVGLLQQLNRVKFLRLNSELVEFLSSSVELISHKPSPFDNLKSLLIYPERYYKEAKHIISTEIKSYFLSSSPSAAFKLISREESEVAGHTVEALNNIADLWKRLEQEKIHYDKAHMEQVKAEVPFRDQERMRSCWKDLRLEIKQGKRDACYIISSLEYIEDLMTELPASNRAKLQPSYSSLCVEAKSVISKIMNYVKIKCDEK